MMKIAANWTDDCQGKRDFDGEIVSISTRYWPQGGGTDVLIPGDPRGLHRSDDPTILPSAHSSIVLHYQDGDRQIDLDLAEKSFTDASPTVVQQQVEAWAAAQLRRITSALRKEFNPQ